MSLTIGILLCDDAEELDFVGPWEVFAAAAREKDEMRVRQPREGGCEGRWRPRLADGRG